MRRRTNAAPCWSPFWPVRAATPSAARPKPYGISEHTSSNVVGARVKHTAVKKGLSVICEYSDPEFALLPAVICFASWC
jgi:hypothetical protein